MYSRAQDHDPMPSQQDPDPEAHSWARARDKEAILLSTLLMFALHTVFGGGGYQCRGGRGSLAGSLPRGSSTISAVEKSEIWREQ